MTKHVWGPFEVGKNGKLDYSKQICVVCGVQKVTKLKDRTVYIYPSGAWRYREPPVCRKVIYA